MASVRLERLQKTFRGTRVLAGIDLTIEDGEFVTFVGPSGSGKSTLMNIMAGLEEPTHGRVWIDGTDVTNETPKNRGVAMVFQSYALYPHMTVRKNLAFPLEIAKMNAREIEARVVETANRLGIGALLERKPKELSGGQRQRVALGRALVRRPRLCLFDEPLSNLDAALRTQMRGELKKLHEDLKATFIYVTHDQAEAMTLSDRVVVLNAGVIEQVASPRDLYCNPKNLFVARFVGSPQINIATPETFGLCAPAEALSLAGQSVLAAVRPENVRALHHCPRPNAANAANAIEGRVYIVEPMGGETWVTIDMIGDVGTTRITARAEADFAARSGSRVWLDIDESRVLWFNAKTHERV
ncbi:MAG: ABC transporter ATP-binding protein [Polyangiaceae bacterium]|nr:ABC transporter ATP-binding protein [Polyangiaceae bacterium]